MRFDSKLMFSDGQSISGTSGTSTNTLDLNKAGVSEGELYVILSVSGSALPTSSDAQIMILLAIKVTLSPA